MLSCKQFTDRSSDQLDKPYKGWKRVEMAAHRIICRHCRRFERHLKRSRDTSAAIARRLWGKDNHAADHVFQNIKDRRPPDNN